MTLQEWMDKRKLNDAQVAARVDGLSRSQVSRIRRGVSRPSPETALKLSQLTKIPPQKLIFAEQVA
jgi:transcriptional regulator with XRE-family HTH domain